MEGGETPLTVSRDSVLWPDYSGAHREGDNWIVSLGGSSQFIEIPNFGYQVLCRFDGRATVEEVRDAVAVEFGQDVDVEEFAGELLTLGFLSRSRVQEPAEDLTLRTPLPVRVAFSSRGLAIWFALSLLCLICLSTKTRVIPSTGWFFVTNWTGLNVFLNVALGLAFIAFHEGFHWLAARSKGASAHIRLGNRLQFLVVETDVTAVWSCQKRDRICVYLAGMASDMSFLAIAYMVVVIDSGTIAERFAHSAALILSLSMASQFMFYMRTDVYFLVQDFTGTHNLYERAMHRLQLLLRGLLSRFNRARSLVSLTEREKEPFVVHAYAALLLVGGATTLAIFFIYEAQIMIRVMVESASQILRGSGSLRRLDGLLALTVDVGAEALLLVVILRKNRDWIHRLLVKVQFKYRKPLTNPQITLVVKAAAPPEGGHEGDADRSPPNR